MSARVAGLDFVVPDLFDAGGGIARISCALALAMARWCEARAVPMSAHALMDFGGRRKLAYLPEPCDYVPYDGSRGRLARALIERAWAAPRARRVVVFAHPFLATVALALPPWTRTVAVAHGIDVWTPLRPERRLALKRLGALWAVSEDTGRRLVAAQGVDAGRVRVVENALDPYVGSSRVDLQACKLEYSIVSPK